MQPKNNQNHNDDNDSSSTTTTTTTTFNLRGVKVQHLSDVVTDNNHHNHHNHHNHVNTNNHQSSSTTTTTTTLTLDTQHNSNRNHGESSTSLSTLSSEAQQQKSSDLRSSTSSSSISSDDDDDNERIFKDPRSNARLGIGEDHVILLPHHHERVNHFALDIGGSLVKMVYYEAEGTEHLFRSLPPKSPIPVHEQQQHAQQESLLDHHRKQQKKKLTVLQEEDDDDKKKKKKQKKQKQQKKQHSKGARICFARFKTADIEDCLSFIESLTNQYGRCDTVHATGGGSFKFAGLLEQRLGIKIKKLDEMGSLIAGLNFLLKNIHDETFLYKQKIPTDEQLNRKTPHSWMNCEKQYLSFKGKPDSELYPYLLVNIGSGVSIVRVFGDNQYERVSGSSIGGGTFWGLGSLLTGCDSFEELLDMTLEGDNRQVDMLVGDIYGRDYAKIGLRSDTIASTFGKTATKRSKEPDWNPKGADVAKSLLFMICNNIGQIAFLNAMKFGLTRIYFAGYFIRDHPVTMHSISYAIDYWSKGGMQALFLKHEGYLGAIGSFFNSKEHNFIVDDVEEQPQ